MPVFFTRRSVEEKGLPCTVTITSAGKSSHCYATINGANYYSVTSGIVLDRENYPTITLKTYEGVYMTDSSTIYINGTAVVSGYGSYEYTVPDDVTTVNIQLSSTSIYKIYVTTS